MNAKDITDWVKDWGPLITLISTVVLAAITAWLAYLTKVMSDSAAEAANHSRVAAEASLASVAAAEAAVNIKFDVSPVLGTTVGELERALEHLVAGGMDGNEEVTPKMLARLTRWAHVELTCRGNTVTVHGLTLTAVSRRDETEQGTLTQWSTTHQKIALTSTETLPRICHEGESLNFEVGGDQAADNLAGFQASVRYSIGTGPIRGREVEWKPRRTKKDEGIETTEGQARLIL